VDVFHVYTSSVYDSDVFRALIANTVSEGMSKTNMSIAYANIFQKCVSVSK
jgi:hypothetical protein